MIWFEKTINAKQQPEGSDITLQGLYNEPESTAMIQIRLLLTRSLEDTVISKILYEHNPSMLRQEDPEVSDILFKYQSKINKIISKVSEMTFDDLTKK